MHGGSMVFSSIMPMEAAFMNYLMPLGRRPRCRLPADERPFVLGVPVRQALPQHLLAPGRGAGRRVVRLRAEHQPDLPAPATA